MHIPRRSLLSGALLLAVAGFLLLRPPAQAASSGEAPVAWAQPSAMAIRKVGAVRFSQDSPNFLSNLDCTLLTYRQVSTQNHLTGCFTETTYGMIDVDQDVGIFGDSDEGVPLVAYSGRDVLLPWPGASPMIDMAPLNTGGVTLSLYTNPLGAMVDQRDFLGHLVAKTFRAGPNLPITTPDGQPLVINPQTISFSSSGYWMVAETLNGAFVRFNLATLKPTAFAPSYHASGSPALLKSQVAVSDDGRYVAIANEAAAEFKVYDLTTCTDASSAGNPCKSYDYWPFAMQKIPGTQTIRHVRFVNDGLLSFEATSSDSANDGVYELAPTSSITSLISYLGTGDSYTSGEGAYDYTVGTDSATDECHLSAHSYPLLLAHDLFAGGGHSVACSGAVINDVGSTSANYVGQVGGGSSFQNLQDKNPGLLASIQTNFIPGYIAQRRFVQQYQPAITTVSVGGDDIGFGDVVLQCVELHLSLHTSDGTCYNTYEQRLEIMNLVDKTKGRLTGLYRQLLRDAPDTRLYVVGYPQIVSDTGNCALNVHLNKSELEFAEELTAYLNSAVQSAATAAGVQYVDISQALAGHRLCETASYNVAVNGLTAGNDAGAFGIKLLGKESYHPNALGQELIEQSILKQTHNFAGAVSVPGSIGDFSKILSVPSSGQAITNHTTDSSIVPEVIAANTAVTFSVDGNKNALLPNTSYAVHLDGPTGAIITTLPSDNQGNISGSVILPPATSAGGHTIDVTGSNQADEPITITSPVLVTTNPTDSDGDGIPNTSDSCPLVPNSGIDADKDGIDDACDGFIGPASGTPTPINSSTSDTLTSQATQTTGVSSASVVVSTSPINTYAQVHIGTALQSTPVSVVVSATKTPKIIAGSSIEKTGHTPVVNLPQSKQSHRVAPYAALYAGLPIIEWLPYIVAFGLVLLLAVLAKWYENWPKAAKMIGFFSIVYYNKHMNFIRKFFVYIVSAILLSSLVIGAGALSIDLTLSKPTKVEAWLNQSHIYDSAVNNIVAQAKTAFQAQLGSVSLTDAQLKQAATAALPPSLLNQYTTYFLNANYDWLEGKTQVPTFVIDLTQAKQNFAAAVGQQAKTYLTGLPICTTAQLLQLQREPVQDPFKLVCRPAQLAIDSTANSVTAQLAASNALISKPVLNANTLNANSNSTSKPYYKKLSFLPKAYQLTTKLPAILGAVAVVCSLGILLLAPRKRAGLRKLGYIFAEAGIILIVAKFVADAVYNTVQRHVLAEANASSLESSITSFLHLVKTQIVGIEFDCGLAFLAIGIVLFLVLLATKKRKPKAKPASKTEASTSPDTDNDDDFGAAFTPISAVQQQPTAPTPQATPTPGAPAVPANRQPRPRRPRLIQ